MHRSMSVMRLIAVALLLSLVQNHTLLAADSTRLDALAWLAGSWSGTDNGIETEEHWTVPKGKLMLGMNRTFRKPDKSAFEFMRIVETDSGLSLIAQPGGKSPTEFPAKEVGDKMAIFENPDHDFPQRVIYRLDDQGRLSARIEGTIQGKKAFQEWLWTKVK